MEGSGRTAILLASLPGRVSLASRVCRLLRFHRLRFPRHHYGPSTCARGARLGRALVVDRHSCYRLHIPARRQVVRDVRGMRLSEGGSIHDVEARSTQSAKNKLDSKARFQASPNPLCTVQVDAGMKLSLWLAGGLLVTTCAFIFALVLEGEVFQDQTLAVFNALLAYPIVAYGVFTVYQVGSGL